MKSTVALRILLFVVFFLVLAACAPTPTATPMPTSTALPTATTLPNSAPTETPTLLPAVTATSTTTFTPTASPIPLTLRTLADAKGIEVGDLIDSPEETRPVNVREFNLGVATFSWRDHVLGPGQFKFTWTDFVTSFVLRNKMKVRFHHLVFPQLVPDWLVDANLTREQMVDILRDTITQVMSHYRGKIKEWVVVNEPYIYPYRQNDIFYKRIGSDYIEIAFQAARDTDSSAILIYNDSENHTASGITTQLTRDIIQRLKPKGLIDGVGLQMHLNGAKPPDKQDVIATMKSYGVPVYVTEFDVNMKDGVGTRDERNAKQAMIYKDMFEACLESGVCKSFTFWGIGDKYSWIETHQSYNQYSPNGAPTMFDDNLEPKPAYFAIRDVLSGK